MPIYVFTCSEHGVFDVFQNMNDEHKAVCPICKKEANRIYYPPQLKCKDSNVGYTASELTTILPKKDTVQRTGDNTPIKYRRKNCEK